MTALPQHMYRDPLEILEHAERRTCKGCIHKRVMLGIEVCDHPRRQAGKAEKRCKHYDNGEEK